MTGYTKNSSTYQMNYDAIGNRIYKTAQNGSFYYVYDAKGNVLVTYTVPNGDMHNSYTFDQYYLYGSIRVRSYNPGVTITGSSIQDGGLYFRTRGKRNYELTNHLGNVLAIVSDRKVPKGSGEASGTTLYFDPDVLSAQDYYPFGQIMPGRYGRLIGSGSNYTFTFGQSSNYRYGFNGKENDNEIKGFGNEQDYGMRVYDPRVGRFLSVDPLESKYPELTPYQFAGNTPIWATDLDGLEPNYNTSKPSDGLSSPQDNLRSFNLVEQAQFANQKINKIASFEKASYIVQSGDNVSNISKDLHVSITQLMDENHLGRDGKIFPGQKLSWTKAVSFNPTPGNINSVDDPLTGIPGLIKGFEVGMAKMVIGEEVAAAKGVTSLEKASGSYLLEFQSGKFYAGKGLESRMMQSINRIETTYGDKLLNKTFYPAANSKAAFINEHNLMRQFGGPKSFNPLSPTYNKIFSPGRKLGGF